MDVSAAPVFHHTDSGTPEKAWTASHQFRDRPILDLSGMTRLVVVAAHPDDETLMAGGLIVEAGLRGLDVDVIVATDGEASHPYSPTHTPERLVEVRRREVAAALNLLSPDAVLHCPGLGDGNLATSHDDLVQKMVDIIGVHGSETLLVSTWRGDAHPDHEAAALAAASAAWRTDARLMECPIWFWHWASPHHPLPPGSHLPLSSAARQAKHAAMREHHSQVDPLSPQPGDEAILNARMMAHFDRHVEVFFDGVPGEVNPFEELHAIHRDPWNVRSSWYEARKRRLTLAALPRSKYPRVFELGCSVGALTEDLAGRAGHVWAVDESAAALRRADAALAHLSNVDLARLRVPEELPELDADLIVVSEIGYFLSPARMRELARRIASSRSTTVLACHWRHEIVGWPLDGPAVHAILQETLEMPTIVSIEDADFVLQVFSNSPGACP